MYLTLFISTADGPPTISSQYSTPGETVPPEERATLSLVTVNTTSVAQPGFTLLASRLISGDDGSATKSMVMAVRKRSLTAKDEFAYRQCSFTLLKM
jgi:hypothetical protein